LVQAYGEPLQHPVGGVTHLFPTADALARADPDSLPMPQTRRTALQSLARALANGEIALEPGVEPALLALPGIGPWTVAYISMRALRDPDAFIPTDLGVRKALERLGGTAELAERWRPYRAYALQHLWATLG
jgi:AraC family transcriptional regulator of adaptative response / DNA-3-methyladenine glycosylase II